MTPYKFVFDSTKLERSLFLKNATLQDLNEFCSQVDQDVSDFGRNQKNNEYAEMIVLWIDSRNQVEKIAKKKIMEAMK